MEDVARLIDEHSERTAPRLADMLIEGAYVQSSKSSFYEADIVALVAVRSPTEYLCFILPVDVAEKAAQLHLDASFRFRNWKPGKTHLTLEPSPRAKDHPSVIKERELISCYRNERGWARLLESRRDTTKSR
jgi:hypothetical protein